MSDLSCMTIPQLLFWSHIEICSSGEQCDPWFFFGGDGYFVSYVIKKNIQLDRKFLINFKIIKKEQIIYTL